MTLAATAPLSPPATARPFGPAVAVLVAGLAAGGCGDITVIGEGQFSRPIAIVSDPAAPLPRMVWRPGEACPGPIGGCESFCADRAPGSCDKFACVPLLIDSGTPLSFVPSESGELDFGQACIELRAGGGLLDAPADPGALAETTASFRLLNAPIVHAPGDEIAGWGWTIADGSTFTGGVIGGNVLRDFALELRHLEGEQPTVAFFTHYPGSEAVLADQGRAYVRLQYPGRLLGRLLNDRCELGDGLDCRLSSFNLSQDNQELLFEATRALVDACVAPPPCTVSWIGDSCRLSRGSEDATACPHAIGESATLLVATGVPGLVLFDDSAARLLGELDQLPDCGAVTVDDDAPACHDGTSSLVLPGWPPLDDLTRLRVRSLGLIQGLEQPTGESPCQRLRNRLQGLVRQCEGFAAEGRPVQPVAQPGTAIGTSAVVVGEVAFADQQLGPDPSVWIEARIVPATAAPVIALRREVVPEGAQPDGMVGGAMLRETETVLDFTEADERPGVRVRCLDPGARCLALPICEADDTDVELEGGRAGRTGCCYGVPTDLIAEVVLEGKDKQAPRVEDACCPALPRAAITDLQLPMLDLCTDVELP